MPLDSPADRWRPHSDVVAQRLGDAGVLVDLRSGAIFELNETGLRVWELIAAGASATELVSRLKDEFDGEGAEIETDVEHLLTRLIEAGLLER